MLNHQFLAEFSQNFIQQVQRVLNIDGYLMYSVENNKTASDYHAINISKTSIDEYLKHGIENDPVSYKRFYHKSNNHVELLSQYTPSEAYSEFMQRWKVADTAEIYFRKRSGAPVFGISMVRASHSAHFTHYEKNILNSFYSLSEKYFQQHVETVDKSYLSSFYSLTKKELIVLEQMLSGLNNSLIANNLNCSLATVKTHIQHIYQKIDVCNRQELLCKFLK